MNSPRRITLRGTGFIQLSRGTDLMKTEGTMTTTAAPGENDGKKPNISADQVRKLRERSGAPMMDCKKALQASNGNEEAAVDWLRKQGISTAAKKAARGTSEGCVASYIHAGGKIGGPGEGNEESDFVARADSFKDRGKDMATHSRTSETTLTRTRA